MKNKKRILVFSDVHFSVRTKIGERRWYYPMERMLPGKLANLFLQYWDFETQRCFQKMLDRASRLKPFNFLIDLGDGTPGDSQRGLITEKTQQEYLRYRKFIDKSKPES